MAPGAGCVMTAFGVRECIRVLTDRPTTPTKSATILFWLGVVGFFALAGLITWAVMLH